MYRVLDGIVGRTVDEDTPEMVKEALERLERLGAELELSYPPPFPGLHPQESHAAFRTMLRELRAQASGARRRARAVSALGHLAPVAVLAALVIYSVLVIVLTGLSLRRTPPTPRTGRPHSSADWRLAWGKTRDRPLLEIRARAVRGSGPPPARTAAQVGTSTVLVGRAGCN